MTNELLVWTCIQLGANFKDCFSKQALKTMVVNEYVFSRVKWSVQCICIDISGRNFGKSFR